MSDAVITTHTVHKLMPNDAGCHTVCLGLFLVACGLYVISCLLGVAEALDPGVGRTDVMMLFSMAPLVLQTRSRAYSKEEN